jgi:hypothetical protein
VVIKMRGGNHAKDIREYEITSQGVVILGKRLENYQGLISGIPVHSERYNQKEESWQEPGIGSEEQGNTGESGFNANRGLDQERATPEIERLIIVGKRDLMATQVDAPLDESSMSRFGGHEHHRVSA